MQYLETGFVDTRVRTFNFVVANARQTRIAAGTIKEAHDKDVDECVSGQCRHTEEYK